MTRKKEEKKDQQRVRKLNFLTHHPHVGFLYCPTEPELESGGTQLNQKQSKKKKPSVKGSGTETVPRSV